jgi:hypothetical protein
MSDCPDMSDCSDLCNYPKKLGMESDFERAGMLDIAARQVPTGILPREFRRGKAVLPGARMDGRASYQGSLGGFIMAFPRSLDYPLLCSSQNLHRILPRVPALEYDGRARLCPAGPRSRGRRRKPDQKNQEGQD